MFPSAWRNTRCCFNAHFCLQLYRCQVTLTTWGWKKKGRHGCVNVPFVSRCDCKTKNSVVPIRDRLTLNTHSWSECVLTGRRLPGQRSVSRCQTRAALQQVPSVASVRVLFMFAFSQVIRARASTFPLQCGNYFEASGPPPELLKMEQSGVTNV